MYADVGSCRFDELIPAEAVVAFTVNGERARSVHWPSLPWVQARASYWPAGSAGKVRLSLALPVA